MHPLHDRVLAFIDDPAAGTFEQLALDVFAHQFEHCEPYQRFCLSRGTSPDTVAGWQEVPPVPVQAFKRADLCCSPPERTFLSSGTTAGAANRSRHRLPDLRLYRRSATGGLRRFLFPDVHAMRLVSLIPPAREAAESSLAQMVAWAMEEFGEPDSVYAAGAGGLDFAQLAAVLGESEHTGRPVCLMTTTGALIRWFDYAHERGLSFRLPHGSRVMDTGGDKGAPRPLSPNGVRHACWNAFAVPGYFCVNEYGMAELSSQYYDSVIADRIAGRHRPRRKLGPHWLRTRVLDPVSLAPVAPGEAGLLCHVDLANAGTVMAVLSEDLGRAVDDVIELLGRAAGAETRGCSLTVAEFSDVSETIPLPPESVDSLRAGDSPLWKRGARGDF